MLHHKLMAERPHPHDHLTHRQTPWTDDSFLLFATFDKAESTDGRTDRQTDRWTDGRMLPSTLSPGLRSR